MKFAYRQVEKTPNQLENGVVYVNPDFELATLLCACGCGHRITLLVPDGHTVEDVEGLATIYPSVGVWDAPCKSHFYVTQGEVQWCSSWSDERIKSSMLRQRERHEYKSMDANLRWYQRLWRWLRQKLSARKTR